MMLLFTAQSFIFLDLSQFQQIRDLGFPSKCHDMYTLTVWLALFDNTCSDLNTCDTCFCLFFVCFQFLEHFVRNMNTGNIVVHEFCHSGRFRNNDTNLYSVQVLLTNIQRNMEAIKQSMANGGSVSMDSLPSTSVRMAITVLGVLPVMIIYPFVQKYFVRGIAVGAVKG